MSNPEHNKFGQPIGGTRWFNAEPKIDEREVKTYEQMWRCPIDNCSGEMEANGFVWPTGDPGYHHTCDVCGFTAAIKGQTYPRVITR